MPGSRARITKTTVDSANADGILQSEAETVLIWKSGLDRGCNYFNTAWLEFTGRTLKQELGIGWTEGVHPDDLQNCLRIYNTSFDARQAFTMEYRLRRSDGAYRWVLDDGKPKYAADGDFLGYEGCCIDVTEYRNSLNAQREMYIQLALATDGCSDGFWDWKIGSDEVYYSPRFAKLLGYSSEAWGDLLEQFNNHLHPDDFDATRAAVIAHLDHGKPFDARYRLKCADGHNKWFRSRAKATRDVSGKPLRLSGSIQDIDELVCNERKRIAVLEAQNNELHAEVELRKRAEKKFLDLYDRAADMHLSIDVRSLQITQCNQTLLDVLGYSKENVVGRPVTDFYDPDSRELAKETAARLLEEDEVHDVELQVRKRDGSVVDVSLSATVLRDATGDVAMSRSTWRDITELKQAEHILRRKQDEIVHLGRYSLMGQLAAGLAHELNQPLYAIANYANGCVDKIADGKIDESQLLQVAQEVATEAERAGNIIRQLRAMVKQQPTLSAKLNINDTLLECKKLFSAELRNKKASLHFKLDDALPDAIGDVVQLQQVFLNLFSNALTSSTESTDSNGVILVETRSPDSETVEISVTDSGEGIPTENIPRLFDPFFSTKKDGMGMGLAISRSIVEGHCGQLTVRSKPRQGATFIVSLPVEAK